MANKKKQKLPQDEVSRLYRYERFAKEYLTNGYDYRKAYIAAGYVNSVDSAIKMLDRPEVKKVMAKIYENKLRRLHITHADITREFKDIVDVTVGDVYKNWTELKKFDDLTYEEKKAIKGIETRTTTDKEGNVTDHVKITFYDRMEALKELGKNVGYYEKDNNQKAVQNVAVMVGSPELAKKLENE